MQVRGDLGPVTVWTTPDTWQGKQEEEHAWSRVYSGQHDPTPRPRRNEPVQYTELKLAESIRLKPGESCGLYVHSALPGDEGLVYDNAKGSVTYQDRVLKVLPGVAHLSNRPFGTRGFWGRPWRTKCAIGGAQTLARPAAAAQWAVALNACRTPPTPPCDRARALACSREFVGRIQYGVRWRMWNPEVHSTFPIGFQQAVMTMILASRRPESPMYRLQDEARNGPPHTRARRPTACALPLAVARAHAPCRAGIPRAHAFVARADFP